MGAIQLISFLQTIKIIKKTLINLKITRQTTINHYNSRFSKEIDASVAKLVDARDLKSLAFWACRFDSGPRHHRLLKACSGFRYRLFLCLKFKSIGSELLIFADPIDSAIKKSSKAVYGITYNYKCTLYSMPYYD